MDTAKKETEASDGKYRRDGRALPWGRAGSPPADPPLLSAEASCCVLVCFALPQSSFLQSLFWKPWPIVNST